MNGLLIYDNSKNNLVEKIKLALACYEAKRESRIELKEAEVCLINPLDADGVTLDEVSKECGVIVKSFRSVTRYHLWVGYEDIQSKVKA